ncbi:MAG: GAF domain-containing protein [Ignavibacterium sp.]|jgi:GAF domain-containing protein
METIRIRGSDKKEIYEEILPQLKGLLEGERDFVANMANASSVLRVAFPERFSWVGFYLTRGNELVLGPFQGKPACVRIALGNGVCGTAAVQRRAIIVPDVEQFPGHIACDPDSRSEIVVPMLRDNELIGVLDVDSNRLNEFDEMDKQYLQQVVDILLAVSGGTSRS